MLLGGQETTTSALGRLFWILAREPEAQARLRSEIRKAKIAQAALDGHDGNWEDVSLPYDTLVGLPYLDAVVRETMRMHPPTNMINRVYVVFSAQPESPISHTLHCSATKDAVLPVEFPLISTSGEEVRAVHVPAGTNVVISILGANHNKAVWGNDADVWRPERWLTASGERIGLASGNSLDLAFGDEAGEVVSDDTPGYKAGVKYPGVYATMCVTPLRVAPLEG